MKPLITQSIPPQRLVLYTALFAIVVIVGSILWTQSEIADAENNRQRLVSIGEQIKTKVAHQEQNRLIMKQFSNKDPLYLHKHLDTMRPLSAELEKTRSRVAKGGLPEDAILEKRIQFLTSGENNFAFVEGALELSSAYKETVEQQSKPIEVDNTDLETIFSLLEQPRDDTPHLIISEARIARKKGVSQEVWEISLKVIRREYIE